MLLAIDLENSKAAFGIFEGRRLVRSCSNDLASDRLVAAIAAYEK